MNLQALYKIGYGVYVIGSKKGDKFNGQIANTVFQVTSEPPTIAISINKKNLTHEYITDSGVFTATVLCQETPLPFIGKFGFKSGRETNKLEGINYKTGVTGAPVILDNAVSYFECRVIKQLDVETHTIFVGEVVAAEMVSEKVCLTYDYYHQMKRGTTPKTAPSYIPQAQQEVKVKMRCTVCGWIYDPDIGDPDGGIKPGTPFESIPDSWVCPVCGAPKSAFERV